jgi:hypothetical protein
MATSLLITTAMGIAPSPKPNSSKESPQQHEQQG